MDPVRGKAEGARAQIGEFARGLVGGADGPEAGSARVAGDIVGSLLPGLGELKGLSDIFEGVRGRDGRRITSGLIQLIPVAGAAAKALPKTTEKLGRHVAKKGVSKTALQLAQVGKRSIRRSFRDPAHREKLAKAASAAGELALAGLVQRLESMREAGETPSVEVRTHPSFIHAREAAEAGMGARPDASWHDLDTRGDDGHRAVVGRHHVTGDGRSERGFRILAPSGDDDPTRVCWWSQPAQGEPSFGVETCHVTADEIDRIMAAYLHRTRSFRARPPRATAT